MKPGTPDVRHERLREPQILSLLVSVGLHGMAVMLIVAGTWLWGAATFKPLPSYTVGLVDAPLSLKKSLIAVKPESQVSPSSSPKTPAPKPSPPPKPVAKPAQPKPIEAKPVKPKPAQAKLPPSKTVKPIAKPKKTRAKPQPKVAASPKKTKAATGKARPRAPAKRLAATSAEAESTLAKLRHRQAQEEVDRQQAETVGQQAAAQRLADLRQQVSQDDAVGRAAVQAVGLQQVRLAAYQERLRAEIVDAWVLPLPPEQSRELRATAFFRVLRDGRVEQLSLVHTSGNTLFDASLMRAIKRASPLPHLPPDYPADVLEVELRFQARES